MINLTIEEKINLAKSSVLTFEEAVILSIEEDERVVSALARNSLTPIYILLQLASHESPYVRRRVARNVNATASGLELLARDRDHGVRQCTVKALSTKKSIKQSSSRRSI